MAEPTKHVFSRDTDDESNRIPRSGDTPRVDDTLVGAKGSPDPDYHPEAQANALTDTEAGAMPDDEMGGIVPLKRRD